MLTSTPFLYVIATIAGSVLPGAFAPHDLWPLAILSPMILLWLWLYHCPITPRAFFYGLFYGLGMFGVGVSWVFVSIHYYGNTNVPLAILITTLFVIVLALFIAIQGYVLKRFFRGNQAAFALLGFPIIWVLFEWLRSWLLTGFPWLYLGYSQLDTFLGAYAPLGSVYSVSLAVALTSGTLVAILFQKIKKIRVIAVCLLFLIWGTGFLLQHFFFTEAHPKLYTVSLIQGNIKPFDKFSQTDPIGATEKSYRSLTQNQWGVDVILWPESAIALPFPHSEPYINTLHQQAKAYHSTLITGIQVINGQGEYHNSLIAIGKGRGIYHKYHLLPFGDFVPFERWLRGLIHFFDLPMSSFTDGPQDQALIKAGDLKLEPLICYEIAFPELVRRSLKDADAIVNLSEDGWFGSSWGPHQHLQVARMRALETGRFVLRATPSGITAIIDPKGKLLAITSQFEATVLKGTFQAMKGNTPWVKIGFWPWLMVLWACFILPGRFTKRLHTAKKKAPTKFF